MAVNAVKLFLLAYDIADPERLGKVHRTVKRQGMPLQYSVFLVPATAAGIDALLGDLAGIIEPRADDIRVYTLPARLDVDHYGRQLLPDGVQIVGEDSIAKSLGALVAPRNRD